MCIALVVLFLPTLLGLSYTSSPPTAAWLVADRAGTGEIFNYPFAAARGPGRGQLCTAGYFEGKSCFGEECLRSAGHHDGYIVARSEADGKVLWVRQGTGSSNIWPTQLCATEQQMVVLVGRFIGRVEWDEVVLTAPAQAVFVVAFRSEGTLIWASVVAAEDTNHTVPAAAGSRAVHWHDSLKASVTIDVNTVYVAGTFRGSAKWSHIQMQSSGGADTFVAALDLGTGAVQWAARGGGTHREVVRSVAAASGRVFIGGDFSGQAHWGAVELQSTPLMEEHPQWGDSNDAYCVAYNSSTGQVLWGWAAGGSAWDRAAALAVNPHTLLLAADAYGTSHWGQVTVQALGNDGSKPHSVLVGISPADGKVLWARPSTGSSTVWSAALEFDTVFVAGSFYDHAQWPSGTAGAVVPDGDGLLSNGESDGFVAAFDAQTGDALWAIGLGGAGIDHVSAVGVLSNRLLVVGFFYSALIWGQTTVLKAQDGASAFVVEFVLNRSTPHGSSGSIGDDSTTSGAIASEHVPEPRSEQGAIRDKDWEVVSTRDSMGVAISADHAIVLVPMLVAVCVLPICTWWWRHVQNKLTD